MALALTCHPQRTNAVTIRMWRKLNKHFQMSLPLSQQLHAPVNSLKLKLSHSLPLSHLYFRFGHHQLLIALKWNTHEYDTTSLWDPQSWWINRWITHWPVTLEEYWEHSHSGFYWSAVAGAQGIGPRMEIGLGCGDKWTHWGQQVVYGESQATASLSTPAIDLLLMILGQLNMHDIEWLCLNQTVSHLHAVCECSLIDPVAVDLYLFVNTFNWVYSL